jgi:hypothetical protein
MTAQPKPDSYARPVAWQCTECGEIWPIAHPEMHHYQCSRFNEILHIAKGKA